jgi:hypothetical protein
LYLAQAPEPFIVPPGHQGGGMTGAASYPGVITLADEAMWFFTACKNDQIVLDLVTTNFFAKLQLYGSDGALLKTAQDSSVLTIAYTATNCGAFTVLVSSSDFQGYAAGTYGLKVNGLAGERRLCAPAITGPNLTLNGVGGDAGATFVLYSATNPVMPFALWTPVLTNHFDRFGVLTYTHPHDPAARQQFFRFLQSN